MSVLAAAAGARTRRKPRVQIGTAGVQGDWVNAGYGADRGYLIAAFSATTNGGQLASTALNALVDVSVAYTGASHHVWGTTAEVRAVEAPDESVRKATTWYNATSFTVTLTFGAAYHGMLRLYCLDWDRFGGRHQTVQVNDGRGARTANLNQSFEPGAWLHFPVTASTGGTVTITATSTTAENAVISGLWIG